MTSKTGKHLYRVKVNVHDAGDDSHISALGFTISEDDDAAVAAGLNNMDLQKANAHELLLKSLLAATLKHVEQAAIPIRGSDL